MTKLKGLLLTQGMHGMISQVEGLAKALDIDFTHHKVELNNFWKIVPPKLTPISQNVYKKINESDFDIIISCGRKSVNLKGKAYTEDILNSYYRKKNNIRHCVVLNSYAFTDNINKSDDKSNLVYVSQKIEEFKARKFYVKTVKGNIVKFYIWWYGYFLSGLIKNVKSNIRKNLSKIRK